MTNLITSPDSKAPIAYITKGKQRIKQNGNSVYLKDGDEFEIELFNPTQNKIKAEIRVNNKSIGPGIIIRPGERVFLERYTSDSKKFLFSTYIVDDNNNQVREAIKLNGDVTVKFYKELPATTSITYHNPYVYYNGTTTPWTSGTFTCGGSTITTAGYSSTWASTNSLSEGTVEYSNKPFKQSSVETGRVEMGSDSKQSFTSDYTNFDQFPSWEILWKILPISQKHLTINDLVVYCGGCGRKKRNGENYCPSCGRKF